MRNYNVHEALKILQKYYITDSIQMITRWLREQKIIGVPSSNRKNGWIITEDELFDFIEEKRPGLPQIMSVYEEYIKNLEIDQTEKEIVEIKTEIETFENENKEEEFVHKDNESNLDEQNHTLEAMVQQLLEEQSSMNQRMIEIVAQNHDLLEENKTLMELYEIMDKEIRELKKCKSKPEVEETKNHNDVESNQKTRVKVKQPINMEMTFDQFSIISDEALNDLEHTVEKSKIDTLLQELYSIICADEKIKSEHFIDNGTLSCPFSKKTFKQPKRFFKHVIKGFMEKNTNNSL